MSKTRWIRLYALLLALLMLLPLAVACAKQTDEPEEETLPEEVTTPQETTVIEGDGFVPVLRFSVASDIHTRALGDGRQSTSDEVNAAKARVAGLFTASYSYARSNPYYQKLDAVLLVGDYTDSGTTDQHNILKKAIKDVRDTEETMVLASIGNHEFYDTAEYGLTDTVTTETYNRFATYFGKINQSIDSDLTMTPDSHVVINGFHFIGVSPDVHGGRSYSFEKSNWLKEQLEIAKADDPDRVKPIFVYVHIAPNTQAEDQKWSNRYINDRLAFYPQAVVLSGHTHLPAADTTAVVQDNYTLLNTGTMAYGGYTMYVNHGASSKWVSPLGLEGAYVSDTSGDPYTEHGERETAVFTIIEVDANNRVRLRYYDLNAEAFIGEPVIISSIGQVKKFEYTNAKRQQKMNTPEWESDAAVTELAVTPTSARLSFPQATCACTVRNYQLDLYSGDWYVTTIYRLSRYDTALMPERLTAPFSGLSPDTDYTVIIYAINCWGQQNKGPALTYTFHTPAETGAPAPDVFSAAFDAEGAVNTVTGTPLKTNGTVAFDAENGQAATFTGKGAYVWDGIASYYDMMKTSVTLEAVVKATARPASGQTMGIISNYNTEIKDGRISGGISLEYDQRGRVVFRLYLKNEGERTIRTSAALPTDRFAHVAATYDGRTMKIYIDGTLAATSESDTSSVSYTGEVWFPSKSVEQFLVVGGTGNYILTTRHANCLISAANVYARALNESQIRALVSAYTTA